MFPPPKIFKKPSCSPFQVPSLMYVHSMPMNYTCAYIHKLLIIRIQVIPNGTGPL